jgi:hypothetical protein
LIRLSWVEKQPGIVRHRIDVGIDFLIDAQTYGADSAAVRASLPQTHNVKERPEFQPCSARFQGAALIGSTHIRVNGYRRNVGPQEKGRSRIHRDGGGKQSTLFRRPPKERPGEDIGVLNLSVQPVHVSF